MMRYALFLIPLILSGCATARYRGTCVDFQGKKYKFDNNEVRHYKAWELHVKVGEGAYYLFHPSKCALEKL